MTEASARFTPGSRLPLLAALGLPIAAVDGGEGTGMAIALLFVSVLLSGAWLESRRLRAVLDGSATAQPLEVHRELSPRLQLGIDHEVIVHATNPSTLPLSLFLRDDLPDRWESSTEAVRIELPPMRRGEGRYVPRPLARGCFEVGNLHLRVDGGWGLGALIAELPAREEIHVYPSIAGARRFELASRLGALQSLGVRSSRAAGGGGEFAHLREYVEGDAYRDLDWKSTAKRRRPVSRVYQQERSQQVVVCIDAGRMMATPIDGVPKLEHAINAALVLTWAALRQGDRVGLIVFGDRVRHHLPAMRGPRQYRAVLETLHQIDAEHTSVDFRRLIEHVQGRVRRRSLLVVFSDLLDAAHARPLAKHAGVLRRKHVPICVTMDDPVARSVADAPTSTTESVFRRAAAADVLDEREAIKAHLRKAAIEIVEAPASALAAGTVNRYLEIKARRTL